MISLIEENYKKIENNENYIEFLRIYELLKKTPIDLFLLESYVNKILSKHFILIGKLKKKPKNFGFGMSVLFLGTDGTGKTTLVRALDEKLNLKTKQLYLGTANEYWILNFIKKLNNFQSKNIFLNKLHYIFFTGICFPIELGIRTFLANINGKFKVILIDRFPGYPFLNSNLLINKIYSFILPKPDLIVFLKGDALEISRRKVELNKEKTIQNMIKFEKLAKFLSNDKYISIDTTKKSIEESIFIVKTKIFSIKKIYNILGKIDIE